MKSWRIGPIVAGVLSVALIALGCWRLHFDADVLNLLPEDLPTAIGLKLYQTNFANARELILTVQAPDSESCETATRAVAEKLRAATNLATDVVWQPLWLERPADTAEFLAWSWLNQPPTVFGKFVQSLSRSNVSSVVAESRDALTTSFSPEVVGRRSYDPLRLTDLPLTGGGAQTFGDGSSLFSSADGTFHLIFLKSVGDISDYRQCTKWLNEIKAVVTNDSTAATNAGPVKIRYTGRPAFVSEISNGMQQDMAGPSGITLAVIAVLFYWTHRRIKPLLWLTILLLLILGATCAIGGLIFGRINVVSLGFASILLGLAEDFGIVLYQEWRSHPNLTAREVRALAAPGVFWSAVTTCSAFLVLNLGGLPGLGQLGTLVAVGIAVAAVGMLYAYLPPLMRKGSKSVAPATHSTRPQSSQRASMIGTAAVIAACLLLVCFRMAGFDNTPDALRPKKSEAYSAAEEIKVRLKRLQEPLWVLVSGHGEADVLKRLYQAEAELNQAVSNGVIRSVTIPVTLWPNPSNQQANVVAASALTSRREELRDAVTGGGFTTNAFALADGMLNTWKAAAQRGVPFWPTNEGSRWILEKFTARHGKNLFALGLIERNDEPNATNSTASILQLSDRLAPSQIFVSGWEILGNSIFARVKRDFWRVLAPMVVLVLVSLWLAFRSVREVMLSVAALLVTGLILWALMGVAGWSWNLLNLMSVPLLLGMGVDFSIHIQLALQRHHGDLKEVRDSIGRALLLAGSTTVVGFASLALSNNAGMASLGKVCGAGITVAMLVSVYLLPHWWVAARRAAGTREQN